MFPESFPRSTLKFDLYHCLPLKGILRICFHHGFFFSKKRNKWCKSWWRHEKDGREARNLEARLKQGSGGNAGLTLPGDRLQITTKISVSCREYVETQMDNLTFRQWRKITLDVTKIDFELITLNSLDSFRHVNDSSIQSWTFRKHIWVWN